MEEKSSSPKKKFYSRIITDLLPKRLLVIKEIEKYFLLCLIILFFVLSATFYYLFTVYKQAEIQKRAELSKLNYWENVAREHPNYPDALYNSAYYNLRLGDRTKAFNYINEALLIDPNFKEAQVLKDEIVTGNN